MGESTTSPIFSMLLTHTTSGPPVMARVFENVNNTRKIVLHNAREKTLGTRLAIHLVYRATADKLTKAENNI